MKSFVRQLAALAVILLAGSQAMAIEFFLRAEAVNQTMPDGAVVVMWGFAQDTSFGALDGTVSAPGPALVVPPGEATVIIHLDNNLPVPISLTIPGQQTAMTPVMYTAADSTKYQGRVRSLTHETAPGNLAAVDYTWTNFLPGTFIYHSATQMQVQVQMGLYGGITKDFAGGQAYNGVNYQNQVLLFFGEIDPVLHDAVATGNYGDGKTVTSTIGYKPRYFLINGKPFNAADPAIPAGSEGQTTLVRFFNAGYLTHTPMIYGLTQVAVAENGIKYANPRSRQVVDLPALGTTDVLVTPAAGTFTVFDRSLRLSNGMNTPGGQMTKIIVSPGPE